MFSTLIWNIRGVGNPLKVDFLKHTIRSSQSRIMALLEPKSAGSNLFKFAASIGFPNFWHGNPQNTHIWIFWKSDVYLSVVEVGKHHVTARIEGSSHPYFQTFIYASTVDVHKRALWRTLSGFDPGTLPWCLGGDFNSISSRLTEKKGGSYRQDNAIEDFNSFIHSLHLIDAGFSGNPYTWCNNQMGTSRIWLRLDRVLLSPTATSVFPLLKVQHMERCISDHCPLLLRMDSRSWRPRGSFRFQRSWAAHPDCIKIIQEHWPPDSIGQPWNSFQKKLGGIRRHLSSWGKIESSVRAHKLQDLQSQIQSLEEAMMMDYSGTLQEQLGSAQSEYQSLITEEEKRLKELSRVKWLQEGDKNTAFFHACLKERSNSAVLHLKREDNTFVEEIEEVGAQAAVFYQSLYTSNSASSSNDRYANSSFLRLMDKVPRLVTEEQNQQLISLPDWSEILAAIKALNPDSAPGPDGFTGHFYINNLEILQQDILAMVEDFFKGAQLPAAVGSTILTLIPKVPTPTSFGEMRPIGLCNFSYKILSKLLNDRLRKILPGIISEEQAGFVSGRSIHESIAIATEMLNNINKKVQGSNIILKVDIAKAYDTMEWSFILKAMEKFGFSPLWCDMMYRCFSSVWYTVGLQGHRFGFFKPLKGLRQGDPLSPSLFILAQEVFSRCLKDLVSHGDIDPFLLNKGRRDKMQGVSHLLFADDMLVFLNGDRRSLKNFTMLLDSYGRVSGQLANHSKSCFILPDDPHPRLIRRVSKATNFTYRTGPITYLGVPLFKGRPRIVYFQPLLDSIRLKLSNWKNRLLSIGGRLVLIKSVLAAMPIHLMSVLRIPALVLKKINSLMADFLWEGKHSSRIHWVNWRRICLPTSEGGLGILHLESMMKALQSRLAWSFVQGTSLWAKLLRKKYGHPAELLGRTCPRAASHCWKNVIPHLDFIQENSRWIIGRGDIDFWRDRWTEQDLGDQKLLHSYTAVREIGLHSQDDIPTHILEELGKINFADVSDCLVFEKGDRGLFSVHEVYSFIRPKAQSRPIFKQIWHPVHSTKTSIFLWKAYYRGLGVDESFQKRGVSTVSQCRCCSKHQIETLDHLLVTGELATSLWNYYGQLTQFRHSSATFEATLVDWMPAPSCTSQLGLLAICLGGLIPWTIWTTRNDRLFSGKVTSTPMIIKKLTALAISMLSTVKVKAIPKVKEIHSLGLLHFPVMNCHVSPGSWVHWYPPSHGLKLNCDGSSRTWSGAGGGVFRNSRGAVVQGFCSNFGRVSSNEAEALALLEGLKLAKRGGLYIQQVELDSKLLVSCLQNRWNPPWNLIYILRECIDLLPHTDIVNHVFREGNGVADRLAAIGHNVTGSVFFDARSIPLLCMEALEHDKSASLSYRS